MQAQSNASKLKRLSAGQYQTPGGRYNIEHDERWLDGECGCAICVAGLRGCRNNGAAKIAAWHIWDNDREDYLEGTGPEQFDTLRDAREHLGRKP